MLESGADYVIPSAHLRALGAAAGTIVHRCAPGGPWQRILPGLVLLHNGVPTARQRCRAAQDYAGADSLLTGHAALGLHGFANSATMNDVHVLIPHANHRKSISFVKVERTIRLPNPIDRNGIRVAPVSRSLIDAARGTRNLNTCRTLFTEAIQRGLTNPIELAAELAAGTIRGTALARRVLAELFGDAHSVAELDAQRLYATTGLPPMQFNVDIVDEPGTFIARPDGWLDSVGMAWEIDSLSHHLSVPDHERTIRRRATMQRHSIVVVQHLPTQLRNDVGTVLADLRQGYASASARPRPNVRTRS